MYKSIKYYFLKDVLPRWRGILGGSELWISVVIGILLYNFCELIHSVKNGEVGVLLLTYAAIALGFTLTGMTIVLTLPDREFAKKLASSRLKGKNPDAYSDLLFVFSWTAVVHWVLLISVILFLLFCGFEENILLPVTNYSRAVLAILGFIIVYCVCQFLITVITLAQVGNLYINDLHKKT